MKQKNFLWSLLAIMMAATMCVGMSSCKDDDDPKPELSINESSFTLNSNGGEKVVVVTANHTDWTASVTDGSSWLKVNKSESVATISADPNLTTAERTGKIKITATADTSLSYEVSVKQDGADGIISVSVPSLEFEAEGGSQTITVTSNSKWTANSTQGWLTVSLLSSGNPSSASETTSVTLTASENNTNSDRPCIVTFTTADGKSVSVSVIQKKPTPVITVNGTSQGYHEFPSEFDTGKSGIDYKQEFTIKSNVEWTLSGKPEWLNISPTSGNGEVKMTIYPTSENNNSDKDREANLTISGSGVSVTINIIQKGLRKVYVIPDNEVALYDRFCWEYTASPNVNNFQYIILSEKEFTRLSDNELREEVMKEEVLKYEDGWLTMTGYDSHKNRITSNSTYYYVSLASDKDGKYGALQKIKLTTPEYLDADQDAYVSFWNFDNTSTQFQFDAKKEGFCDTYHIVYGIYAEKLNSAVYAFEINYYIKNKKKHWLAKNEYYEWEIIENYPNNHTFSYSSYLMPYFPVCFGYGWGVFKNGKLSSDLLGFQVDTSTSSAPMMRVSRKNDDAPKNVVIKRNDVLKRAKSLRKK